MSDFNIKKFLAESERLSYADFTSGQRRRKPQTPSSELTGFEPQFQPSPCTACDGTGRQPKRGHYSNDPCIHCDGKGELVEGYDDYEGWNDNADEFEPAINMCPSCEGEGCEECGGEGAIHEASGNTPLTARELKIGQEYTLERSEV